MKFSKLAQVYDRIQQTSGEPQKSRLLAGLMRGTDAKTLEAIAHFTAGEPVDPQMTDRLGIGPGAIRAALTAVSGKAESKIDDEVKQTGDLSEVVFQYADGTDKLTVDGLWEIANQTIKHNKDRIGLIERVLTNTTPAGAKYFTRMTLNQMRIGVGMGTLIRSIGEAFEVDAALVERLYVLTNDIGLAATQAQRGEKVLRRADLTLFRPYQFMSAHKIDDPKAIFDRLKGKQIIFEVKYDGARLQIHIRNGNKPQIKCYSRRLNDDTEAMPDVVAAVRKSWTGGDAIIEGEVVAYDKALKKKQPFQAVLTRLGRKHDIEEKARELPLVLYLFDLIYLDGKDLMELPQAERRQMLATLFRPTDRVKLSDGITTDRIEKQDKFFQRAIKAGHEGLMAKDPDATYLPGRRTDRWMKLKPEFETLDVAVVGGIYGTGRRRGLLSSLIVAVRDKDTFKPVGKVGTGFSEATLKELTSKLEPKIITTRGSHAEIEPEMVIEVDFQDIQKTTAYASGYALRIPRFRRERTDKSLREADTIARLKRLYDQVHK
ncbi:MAG: ATP-dependent DNA ligase [Acidobacteriota bacterium]